MTERIWYKLRKSKPKHSIDRRVQLFVATSEGRKWGNTWRCSHVTTVALRPDHKSYFTVRPCHCDLWRTQARRRARKRVSAEVMGAAAEVTKSTSKCCEQVRFTGRPSFWFVRLRDRISEILISNCCSIKKRMLKQKWYFYLSVDRHSLLPRCSAHCGSTRCSLQHNKNR